MKTARVGRLQHAFYRRHTFRSFRTERSVSASRALTVEEKILAAKARGYKYIAFTDHSKRVTMAKGLDARRLM